MENNQERNMKNLFDDNAEVTTLLANIKDDAEQSVQLTYPNESDFSVYYERSYELAAIKAELHMMAQKFPEVEAYLGQTNTSRRAQKQARSREIHMEQTQPPAGSAGPAALSRLISI